jgi:cyclic pyranopterin phosphate synthase
MELHQNVPQPEETRSVSRAFSVAERLDLNRVSPEIARLIELERQIPVTVGQDNSLRPKILDSCGMTCVFCHNEGTPVASAYSGNAHLPNSAYKGGRVSVFQHRNNVNFLPGVMQPGYAFEQVLGLMTESIGSNELHLTGGEPTLHRGLPELIASGRKAGYSVKLTSNGENGASVMRACAEAGLEKVNFSIFGTTPEELAAVQNTKYGNIRRASTKLESLRRSIDATLECGLRADANIVMTNFSHADRVARIIDQYDDRVSVRILNDLGAGDQSYLDIYAFLAKVDAVPVELSVEAGSSNSRVKYILPEGREIYFKQIRRITLPETCTDCTLNNDEDCMEGYYGVRLYIDQEGTYKVGVCLQRMDLTVDAADFVMGDIAKEVVKLRVAEYELLAEHYKDRIK